MSPCTSPMKFTKEKTNIAKGVAICLMFLSHLYSFPERLMDGNYYIPLIPSLNAEFHIGNFGNVCVSMFLFLSGYGMFWGQTSSKKSPLIYSLIKIKDFYLTYWIYFLVFVPIGLLFFKNVTLWNSNEIRYSTDLTTFLEGFLGWSPRYNSEWWFVQMFIFLLLFTCPLYITLAKRNPLLLLLTSVSIFLLSLFFKVGYTDINSFTFWQISFAAGMLCASFNFFSSPFVQKIDNFKSIFLLLFIAGFFVVRYRFGARIDFLFMPVFIYSIVRLADGLRLSNILMYLGSYSFPMWLIHSFFCYYYFQNFIYFPRWSPLIFILLTVTSLLTALSIENLRLFLGRSIPFVLFNRE
ncbi:acyltransferase family protein [Leptothermofonsia sichuanensis]|uniref:acyltransferase family protein n=1 Tax=Leptothermofonsia sichuanensis TaxID=2917832 RepID=UPI0036F40A2B